MLITLGEYERIYKVINTLVVNEGGDPAYATAVPQFVDKRKPVPPS